VSYDVDAVRREEFSWAADGETIYLNNASTGPLPRRTVDALAEWGRLRANPDRISQELQFGELTKGRELIASLIGATPSEIALATNTSFGLNLAAFSLPLQEGDVVVSPEGEFPANVYPWMQLARERGIEHRLLRCDGGVLEADRLSEILNDDRVRVVAVSWVQFSTGACADLRALGALCRARGVYFVVDAIQGLGPLTLDLRHTHVDILACGAQKWLLSPWGSGFTYVRRELLDVLEPHDVSWMGVRGADDFSRLVDYDLTWRGDARRFEFVTLPFQDFAAMNASLELLNEIGAEDAAAHACQLADMLVDWAQHRDDVELVTPPAPEQRAAIVSIRPRDAASASERLRQARVAHSVREGAIRLSPHWYNTSGEIERALDAFAG
jgi:cysteine desulfurase / selenocysteine lyase